MINLFKSKKNQIKTKIVAVAKDEGAYLAEWVHHHLFLGFDAIDIYINRTSDNSLEILHKISEKYPQVNYFTAWQASRGLDVVRVIYTTCFINRGCDTHPK